MFAVYDDHAAAHVPARFDMRGSGTDWQWSPLLQPPLNIEGSGRRALADTDMNSASQPITAVHVAD